jgi:hypothetical protein
VLDYVARITQCARIARVSLRHVFACMLCLQGVAAKPRGAPPVDLMAVDLSGGWLRAKWLLPVMPARPVHGSGHGSKTSVTVCQFQSSPLLQLPRLTWRTSLLPASRTPCPPTTLIT